MLAGHTHRDEILEEKHKRGQKYKSNYECIRSSDETSLIMSSDISQFLAAETLPFIVFGFVSTHDCFQPLDCIFALNLLGIMGSNYIEIFATTPC